MTTLAEIRAQLAAMDAAYEVLTENNNSTNWAIFDGAKSELSLNLSDKMRALVAVVEAAVAFTVEDFENDEWRVCNVCSGDAIRDENFAVIGFNHEPTCKVAALNKALDALK